MPDSTDPQPGWTGRPQGREVWQWAAAGVAGLAVLLTFLYLVRFAYPVNDDWSFAASGRDAGVWASVASYWNDFGGRWSAGILLYGLGVFPDLPAVYPLLIALLFALLAGSGWILLHVLGLRDRQRLCIATIVLAAVQFCVLPILDIGTLGPRHAVPETVYWVSGAVNYSLAYPLIILAAWGACTVRRAWLGWAIAIAGGLWISGLSEMAGIGAAAVGAGLGLLGHRRGWALCASALAGTGIVALAPGNLKRLDILRHDVQAEAGLSQLPRAMGHAAVLLGSHLRDWLLNPALAAGCGIAAWWGAATAQLAGARPRLAVLVVGGGALAAAWAVAVPTIALVGFLEARHEGLVSLVAVAGLLGASCLAGRAWPAAVHGMALHRMWLVWLAVALAWTCLVASPIRPGGLGAAGPIVLCLGAALLYAGLRSGRAAGWLLAFGLLLQPAWWQAASDAFGKAPALRDRQRERDAEVERLIAAGFDRVVVPWLGDRAGMPLTIRNYELQPGWMVEAYAAYLRLKEVRISTRVDRPMGLIDRPPKPAQP